MAFLPTNTSYILTQGVYRPFILRLLIQLESQSERSCLGILLRPAGPYKSSSVSALSRSCCLLHRVLRGYNWLYAANNLHSGAAVIVNKTSKPFGNMVPTKARYK